MQKATPSPAVETPLKNNAAVSQSPEASVEAVTVRRNLTAQMGWSVIKNGKAVEHSDGGSAFTSPGSATTGSATSPVTPPPACSGAVDPTLSGAVPSQSRSLLPTDSKESPSIPRRTGVCLRG